MNPKIQNQEKALSWLKDLRLARNPTLLSQLAINITAKCSNVQDVEIAIINARQEILVYGKPDWITRRLNFKKVRLVEDIHEIITFFLPDYRCRVTFDKKILNKTLDLLEEYKDIYDL